MVQIYHGDGKGKTTAAIGAAVRAAGNGLPVLFAQFLKDDTSGEIAMLKKIGVDTLHAEKNYGFVSRMNDRELEETRSYFAKMMEQIKLWIKEHMRETDSRRNARDRQLCDQSENRLQEQPEANKENEIGAVVVLDEILHAVNYQLLGEENVVEFLRQISGNTEVILTGRNPSEQLYAMADYVTEMKKEKHPYEQGITARKGIEF